MLIFYIKKSNLLVKVRFIILILLSKSNKTKTLKLLNEIK